MLRLIEVLLHPGAARARRSTYAYPLTQKGVRVALLFILATNASADTLGNSLFHRKPKQSHTPTTKLHAAYQKADASLQQIVDLVAA